MDPGKMRFIQIQDGLISKKNRISTEGEIRVSRFAFSVSHSALARAGSNRSGFAWAEADCLSSQAGQIAIPVNYCEIVWLLILEDS
jgi:hypothetical protein